MLSPSLRSVLIKSNLAALLLLWIGAAELGSLLLSMEEDAE